MTRADFQRLAFENLKDAEFLLSGKRHGAAYYAAGFVVECALKACICRQSRRFEFPDRSRANNAHTHDLGKLVGAANLNETLKAALENADFNSTWKTVTQWRSESRYDRKTKRQAVELFHAVADARSGALAWLKQHW